MIKLGVIFGGESVEQKSPYAEYYQYYNGNDKVYKLSFYGGILGTFVPEFVFLILRQTHDSEISGKFRLLFELLHLAVIKPQKGQRDYEHKGKYRIEIIRYGANEKLYSRVFLTRNTSGNGCRP